MKKIMNLALIIIPLITLGLLYSQYNSFVNSEICPQTNSGFIEVEKGSTFRDVIQDSGRDSEFFIKIYLKLNPPNFELQAGNYSVDCGNLPELIQSLKTPLNENDEQVTFLEGWNIYDMDQTLTSKGLIESGEFTQFVTTCEGFCGLKADYGFISDAETLEGFLYPDTYNINPNSFTVEGLVRKMLTNFKLKVIDSGIITDMGSIEIIDVINMASIVQKEANKKDNPEEIAIIAGILKKRAEERWQIGADATVCYAHKISTQDCTPTQVLRYLYDVNEYNTRAMVGLPAGPIANPEASVIEATINSKKTQYYYYLHDNSGQIHYGVTNADHEKNKNTYLR